MLSARSASAQSDDDRATARAAATAGVAEEEAGHWKEAIDLFRRAESLVHAPPHLLHIARAETKLGRLIAARETYLKVTREEVGASAPRAFIDAHAAAVTELAALEPRIASIKVLLDGGEATVTLDGAALSAAAVGIDRPIDPGRHELSAKGDGLASKPIVIEVAEGARQTVHLVLERSAVAADPAVTPGVVTSEPGAAETEPPKRPYKTAAYVAWGVGAAGLVTGTVMMLVNRGKRSDADALCSNGGCPSSKRSEVEDLDNAAGTAATVSWVGYGVGVAGLGLGTVLFLMKGSDTSKAGSAGVVPWIGMGAAGVRARF